MLPIIAYRKQKYNSFQNKYTVKDKGGKRNGC